MEIVVSRSPAVDAATRISRRLRDAVRRRGAASLALSGGSTAPPMITALLDDDVPWSALTIWQVDERVAPDGHPARNANQLDELRERCTVQPMPVTAADLRAAARRYAVRLPDRFDVIHLGVGDDGHTASWPPGRPEVPRSTRAVELVDEFNGWPRMTLTRGVVDLARSRVVLATGSRKRPAIERWLRGDDLPIALVRRTSTVVVVDEAAAPRDLLH